jgi:hypothetical protein
MLFNIIQHYSVSSKDFSEELRRPTLTILFFLQLRTFIIPKRSQSRIDKYFVILTVSSAGSNDHCNLQPLACIGTSVFHPGKTIPQPKSRWGGKFGRLDATPRHFLLPQIQVQPHANTAAALHACNSTEVHAGIPSLVLRPNCDSVV